MIPIQDLLNRIRWDEQFHGTFVLGYYDRMVAGIVRVPLHAITFPPDDHFAFELLDEEGVMHSIPYHRVKEVFRDGELIWHREH